MSGKVFTVPSTQYCRACGSFDLVSVQRYRFRSAISKGRSTVYCYGCGSKVSEEDLAKNENRNLPLNLDSFFLHTKRRRQQRVKNQLNPLALILGVGLIAAAITGLYSFQMPDGHRRHIVPQIEWADLDATTSFDIEALQVELNQIVEAKRIPTLYTVGE